MGKAYASSTLIRLLAIGLNAVGALLLLPLVLKALGEHDFGIWSMASSITGYLLLLDFGIALACTRYLSVQTGDKAAWRRTFSSAFGLSLVLAGLLLVLAALVQVAVQAGWLPTNQQPLPDVVSLLLLEVALTIPLRLYQSILRAEVRYVAIGWFEIVRILLRLLGIPLILWAGGGLMAILVYASAVNVLFFVLMLVNVYWRERTFHLRWEALDWQQVRELFAFSQYTAVAQTAEIFKYRADNLLVGILLGVAAVAPYAIMVVVIDMLTQILMRFQSFWDTIIMRHAGGGRLASAFDTSLTSLHIGLALALLATFDTWLLAAPFLSLWVGDKYLYLAAPLTLFTLILPGLAVQLATAPYFNALGRQRTNAGLALLEIILKLLLLVPLGKGWATGGIILAGVLASSVVSLLRLQVMAGMMGCKVWVLLGIVLRKLLPVLGWLAGLWGIAHLLGMAGIGPLPGVTVILLLQALSLPLLARKSLHTHRPVVSAICPHPHGGG